MAGVAGVLLGTAIHYGVHRSENRREREDGVNLSRRLLIDALQGLGVVALLLVCAIPRRRNALPTTQSAH